MSKEKPLEVLIKKLAESLEDKPDPWFNRPCGWLFKPNFKREAQEIINIDGNYATSVQPFSWKRLITGSPYKKRWFRLDATKKLLSYYNTESDGEPLGEINLENIKEVIYAKVHDAPEFSLDLVSSDKHYTIAAESHAAMVKWAYALSITLSQSSTNAVNLAIASNTTLPDISSDKWVRYGYTYEEPGPLFLNVMGLSQREAGGKSIKNMISVISFEPTADGGIGRSEASGKISVGDYLVGCNNIDFSDLLFNEAMDVVMKSEFPKTLHFLRDTERIRVTIRKQGWGLVYYSTLERHRRRYIEIRSDSINFRKPAPGGAAHIERDSYLMLSDIEIIRCICDRTMPQDQQYILRIFCKNQAIIHQVNEDDAPIGQTLVDNFELCFNDEKTMNSWRNIIISVTSDEDSQQSSIIVEPLQVVDIQSNLLNEKNIGKVAFQSKITGRFSIREFTLAEGNLRWKRPNASSNKVIGSSDSISNKVTSLFLGNSSSCNVTSIRAIEDISMHIERGYQGYKFQLFIETINTNNKVTLGFQDADSLLTWLQLLRESISIVPIEYLQSVFISDSHEKVSLGLSKPEDLIEMKGKCCFCLL